MRDSITCHLKHSVTLLARIIFRKFTWVIVAIEVRLRMCHTKINTQSIIEYVRDHRTNLGCDLCCKRRGREGQLLQNSRSNPKENHFPSFYWILICFFSFFLISQNKGSSNYIWCCKVSLLLLRGTPRGWYGDEIN